MNRKEYQFYFWNRNFTSCNIAYVFQQRYEINVAYIQTIRTSSLFEMDQNQKTSYINSNELIIFVKIDDKTQERLAWTIQQSDTISMSNKGQNNSIITETLEIIIKYIRWWTKAQLVESLFTNQQKANHQSLADHILLLHHLWIDNYVTTSFL